MMDYQTQSWFYKSVDALGSNLVQNSQSITFPLVSIVIGEFAMLVKM
jgi:hypothetical protein